MLALVLCVSMQDMLSLEHRPFQKKWCAELMVEFTLKVQMIL